MRADRAERMRNPPREIQQKLKALADCQVLIKELNQRLRNAEKNLRILESELAPYHASVAPIQDCPFELLSTIFEFSLGKNPQSIRSLMLVCRAWHEILVASSRFWTHVPISFKTDGDVDRLITFANNYLVACCKNSAHNLLDLTLDFSHLVFNFKYGVITKTSKNSTRHTRRPIDSMHFIPSLLDGCQDVIERCQSITLTFPDSEMLSLDIWRSLLLPAPNLASLSIYFAGHAYNAARGTFVGGFRDISSLKSVTLDEVPDFNFLPLPYASIEELELRTDLGRSGTLDLDRFTGLRTLTIIHTAHKWSAESTSPTSTLYLPALCELFLIGNFASISRVAFCMPKIERIYIQQTSGDRNSQPELPTLDVPSVGWSNLDCETGLWSHGSRTQLKKILTHFQKSETLTIPARSKKALLGVVEKLRKQESVPGSWKKVILEDEDGQVETLMIDKI